MAPVKTERCNICNGKGDVVVRKGARPRRCWKCHGTGVMPKTESAR